MAIGKKMGSLKNLKDSMKKGSGGNQWIKYIPKNSTMNVRFTEEPEEWVNYDEHFDQTLSKSFPCNGEDSCPGCASGERKTSRYLTNAIDLDGKYPDKVVPLMLPKDLANRLVVKYEKWGSLTDRDIELSRQGERLDTVYDLEGGVKDPINLGQFQNHDLVKVLTDAFSEIFGGDEQEDDDDALPKPSKRGSSGTRGRAKSKAAEAVDEAPEVDDDEEKEDEPAPVKKKPAKKAASKKAAAKTPEPEFTPEVDDEVDEPGADEPADGPDEDEEEWTEEALRALPLGALRSVARNDFGVSTKGLNGDAIIDAIFEAGDAEEDDDPAPY